jgi:hypothetical protein
MSNNLNNNTNDKRTDKNNNDNTNNDAKTRQCLVSRTHNPPSTPPSMSNNLNNNTNDKRTDKNNNDDANVAKTRQCLVSRTHNPPSTPPPMPNNLNNNTNDNLGTIGQKRFQNQGKNTLSSIVGSYKSVVSKYAHPINPKFAWHGRFHDRIIRDQAAYQRIKNYILNNPKNWKGD